MMGALSSASGVIGWSDVSSVWSSLTSQFNITQLVGVLAPVVATCAGLAFAWFAIRKAMGMIKGSAKSGKLSA